jgi:putative peptidoglycan lipid II flippase
VPSAVALLTFAQPLVAVLYHYGAFTDADVRQTALALMGYGLGLLGLIAIKVLAPGYYASQDIRTPVKIAIVVLAFTQVMNLVFVPWLAHAGLALSIGLGALLNATWLLVGLLRRGTYRPAPGWWRFVLQVVAASAVLAIYLLWASNGLTWLGAPGGAWARVLQLVLVLGGAVTLYFVVLLLGGVKLREFVRK